MVEMATATINGSRRIEAWGSSKNTKNKHRCKHICAVISLICGFALVILGILIVLFFRDLVDNIIKSEIPLKEGSKIIEVWKKPPINPYLKLYFFNVTNPRRFLKGAKPRLREVGPFVYQESWEKVNITFSDDKTQVQYGQKKFYKFRPDLSTDDEEAKLTLLNIPMISAVNYASASGDDDGGFIINALSSMLELLSQEVFVELTVKEILWGYENPLIELAKGIFPPEKQFPFDKFGLFVGKNGTSAGTLTTLTGTDDVMNVGQVLKWNNKTKLDFWKKGSSCNEIKGTDGSLFHPDLQTTEKLYLFNRDLCQSLPLVFQKEVVSQDVPGYRFVPPEDVFSPDNPENKCFCVSEPCNVPKGLFNMSACQFDSPTLISWPHFFQADPKLLEAVEGLDPDQEKHQFYMDLQPKLGTGLRVQARSQINIKLSDPHPDIKPAKGLRDIVFPFLWFSDGIEQIDDPNALNLLKTATTTPEELRSALYPTCFVIGIMLILIVFAFWGYKTFYRNVRTESITPVRSAAENNHYEMKNTTNTVLASSGNGRNGVNNID